MDYLEILNGIRSGLTGDKEHDRKHLLTQSEMYKGHSLSTEIQREIGRLLFNCLPDELMVEGNRVFVDDQQRLNSVIAQARSKINEGNYDAAEQLILSILPNPEDELYQHDSVSMYLSFNNDLEATYYEYIFQPTKTLKYPPFPFKALYQTYSYILFEKREFANALSVLERALERCPIDTDLIFELAEVNKMLCNIETFFELTKKCHQFIYTPQDFARYFRNLGYYFIEKEQWSEAICSFLQSYYVFAESKQKVEAELNYISDKTGIDIVIDDYSDAEKFIGVHGIPFTPELDWLCIALKNGLSYMESNEWQSASHYLNLVYQMTKDDEVLEKLNYCQEHLEGGADE